MTASEDAPRLGCEALLALVRWLGSRHKRCRPIGSVPSALAHDERRAIEVKIGPTTFDLSNPATRSCTRDRALLRGLRVFLPGGDGVRAAVQKLATCLAPPLMAATCWRRACCVQIPRFFPAQALVPLRNRLIAGFSSSTGSARVLLAASVIC